MKEPVWILQEIVISVHHMLLAEHGGAPGIRDEALLDSALNKPQQRYFYGEDISIFSLASSYCYGLARNYPFVDGNKRIALTIAAIFLEVNGYSLNAPEPNTVIIIEELSAGKLTEDDFAGWLKEFSVSIA
ncbi:MAG: type II toxin-antitoxin system death-on-curing family toxin [Gammaproteobacteria bacterium]|nr:type II toxin-antitoxin system death-on-curing family toxin [Gammaproteobacteria bacterium]